MSKLIYGVGVNDAGYQVYEVKNGERVCCRFYSTWLSMLSRCYSGIFHKRYPTYIGCVVADDWLVFSNFKDWMSSQDYIGKSLDKDILFAGNKMYSEETCCFVFGSVNNFLVNCTSSSGDWPIGVSFDKRAKKLKSECRNPISNKREHLGHFTCPNQAHKAWRKRKHELALQLANLQTDERVAQALRTRYL